ncbi:MAG: hypothetical protein P1U42_04880 [Phycisphaerales bacterium]|nr:hypothetical protein [Phycisphaerales bacterium]
MYKRQLTSSLCLFAAAGSVAFAGPDLICSEIGAATTFGSADGKIAYSFATTVCNIGDSELPWDANTNEHPLISQTMYRLKDGQIQQIGIGFVRHTTFPLAGNACGLGCSPAGFTALGAGCSDTSGSSINGSQSLMGPRSEVDPFSGVYPYPFTSINQTGNAIYKRLQIDIADVSDPSALYFVETQLITSAEETPETRANNASYRQVVFSPGAANATVVGPTYAQKAAIYAWRDHGNGIGMLDSSVTIRSATIPNDGIIHVGSKATDLDNGTWRYDYAVHNQNANNAILSLVAPGAGFFDNVTEISFSDVEYHDDVDGLIDGSDILGFESNYNVFWKTNDSDEFQNVIRWGTTYNFSFEVNNEPEVFRVILEYDIPGETFATLPILLEAIVPSQSDACHIDLVQDGELNFYEMSGFLSQFHVEYPGVDLNSDGRYDFFDISEFIKQYSAGCP